MPVCFRSNFLPTSPIFHLNGDNSKKSLIGQMKVARKCFAILAAETRKETIFEIVETLTSRINQNPKFVIVFGDEQHAGEAVTLAGINTTLIMSGFKTKIFSLYCSASNRPVKMIWSRKNRNNGQQICADEKRKIKIAYNLYQPYFYVENQQPNADTLEGIILTTFLEANKLSATYHWAEQKWGLKDDDFNGAIGMASYICVTIKLCILINRLDTLTAMLLWASLDTCQSGLLL